MICIQVEANGVLFLNHATLLEAGGTATTTIKRIRSPSVAEFQLDSTCMVDYLALPTMKIPQGRRIRTWYILGQQNLIIEGSRARIYAKPIVI